MKIIRNKYIPFQGFRAINLFGILFVRGNAIVNERTIRHEAIHTAQMKELWYVFFYLWYVIEWFIRLFAFKGTKFAYRNISFEREAYTNQSDERYIARRKRHSYIKYIK